MYEPGPGGMTMPSRSDTYANLVSVAFDDLEKALDIAVKAYGKLVKKIDEFMPYAQGAGGAAVTLTGGESIWLTGKVLEWIRQKLHEIHKWLKEVIRRAKSALKHQTPVISLIYASFAWLDEVLAPVSGLAVEADRSADRNLVSWHADAAESYMQIKDEQVAAAKGATECAEAISNWLMSVAQANVSYVVTLVGMAADVGTTLIAAVAEISTAVEAPWGVDKAAEAIAKAVSKGIEALGKTVEKLLGAIADARELYSKTANRTTFPDGRWPNSVTV
jgi:hypothetical protein